MKKQFTIFSIATVFFLLVGCVTESATQGAFKKPTKEDMNRAMSLYVQIAYKSLENKDYERAMANVKRALDIDNHSPIALNALAVVYQYQGDTEKARSSFKKALGEDDKFSEGHLNYGQFLIQQKEYDQACEQFQMAADDDFYTKRASAYYNLGMCFKITGDHAKSEAAFNRSLGLDPGNLSVLGQLAEIKFDQGLYAESKDILDRYINSVRDSGQKIPPDTLWLAIRLERQFSNQNAEASWALQLKNNYPYSKEYLEYQNSLKQ